MQQMHFGNYARNSLIAGLSLLTPFISPNIAHAEMIPTDQVVASAADARQELSQLIDREDVKAQLIAFGVSPEEAHQRLAGLSDQEVQVLNKKIASLPVGGDSTVTLSIGAAIIIALLLIIFL